MVLQRIAKHFGIGVEDLRNPNFTLQNAGMTPAPALPAQANTPSCTVIFSSFNANDLSDALIRAVAALADIKAMGIQISINITLSANKNSTESI